MSLNEKEKRHLRKLGHTLEPVLLTGSAGLTPGLLAELDSSLEHHELLKIRVRAGDRDSRDEMIQAMCAAAGAELVHRIGHIALLWRPNPKQRKVQLS